MFVHLGVVESRKLQDQRRGRDGRRSYRRSATRANHSATHFIHEALRQILGTHVAAEGLLRRPRPPALRRLAQQADGASEEIATVEAMANDYVLQNSEVATRLMSLDDARQTGAMALFGEKYGDEVRVVSMGNVRLAKKPISGMVDRIVRRHACSAHWRHRPRAYRRRKRVVGGRPAHRSADRRWRAGISRRARRARARDR